MVISSISIHLSSSLLTISQRLCGTNSLSLPQSTVSSSSNTGASAKASSGFISADDGVSIGDDSDSTSSMGSAEEAAVVVEGF